MLKKTIKYINYNGEEVSEDFYFNLTKTELDDMNASAEGGLDLMIQQIVDSKSVKKIWKLFKTIVLKAYGEKSSDGKHFNKSKKISKAFACTPAYDVLMQGFFNDDGTAAAEFMEGIVPTIEKKN